MAFLTPEEEMSDEEIQQLIALGIIPDKQGMLEQQLATAERLRYGNTPEMRGNGRVQTAANPLEFLVSGLQGHKAGKQIDEIRKQQDELLRQQVEGRKSFFDRLRKKPGYPSQPPGIAGPLGEEYL